MAKITLIGLHNFTDGTIWDGLNVPLGADKETLINTIMLEYGELETLYASPSTMQFAISNWSNLYQDSMIRLWGTVGLEYNPIYNYDRTETETETPNITKKSTATSTASSTANNDNLSENENEHTVSAFDSADYSPSSKDTSNAKDTVNSSANSTGNSDSTETETGTRKTERRSYGNIGVTTTQRMIESERSISKWSWYQEVSTLFAGALLLGIY